MSEINSNEDIRQMIFQDHREDEQFDEMARRIKRLFDEINQFAFKNNSEYLRFQNWILEKLQDAITSYQYLKK